MSQSIVKSFQDLAGSGVAVCSDVNEPLIREYAKKHQITLRVIDGSKAKSASALYRSVGIALDFPEYYNSRTDDFYSFLTDALLMDDKGLFIWLQGLDLNNSLIIKAHAELLENFCAAVKFAKDRHRTFVVVSDPSISVAEQFKEYVA